jgi:hypothetical protein
MSITWCGGMTASVYNLNQTYNKQKTVRMACGGTHCEAGEGAALLYDTVSVLHLNLARG